MKVPKVFRGSLIKMISATSYILGVIGMMTTLAKDVKAAGCDDYPSGVTCCEEYEICPDESSVSCLAAAVNSYGETASCTVLNDPIGVKCQVMDSAFNVIAQDSSLCP